MKEHPILFSGPMVNAILTGRKTMTRRVVKPQPETRRFTHNGRQYDEWIWPSMRGSGVTGSLDWFIERMPKYCPYGNIGDRLWVRETFAIDLGRNNEVVYQADGLEPVLTDRWRPSIFMPRKHSRITLDITGVRVERVQDFRDMWDSINAKRGYSWDSNPWVWVVEFKRLD
jgi:hypothetical protein